MKGSMKEDLKQISCDPECGFQIRSHEEKEVLKIAHEHVKEVHHKDVPVNEMKAMMTSV